MRSFGQKSNMKVSLITTVKNESNSIEAFLDSILRQGKTPEEVVIVDGGSTDQTVRQIKSYSSKIKNLKVFVKKGNRSVGRNFAIKKSTHDIIAVTDAGCILDSHWLENIMKPFENKSIDVSSGFYKPQTNSIFEKCLAAYTCTMPDRLDLQNFLPSSRSVAFRKSAWEKVSGYPENLDTCEDLVFAKRMKLDGLRFMTVKEAIVLWPQRENIFQAARQFFLYAKGDGRAHYFRKTTPVLFARYTLVILILIYAIIAGSYIPFFVLFLFLLLYLLWSIQKNYRYIKNWRAFLYLPLLQIVSDVAVLSGTIIGLASNIWDTQSKQ